jgi:mono/diheme cytochrome c family protein
MARESEEATMTGRGPWVAVLLLLGSCKVSPPGAFESAIAGQVKRHLTVGGAADVNPIAASPEEISRGRSAFGSYCMVCHGLDGHGTGVPFARAMSPPVPDLGGRDVQAYTDGQLHWVIRNGLSPSGMPASAGILSEPEIWRIVLYVRHLPPAGSLGEPAVYGGDTSSGSAP